MENALKYIKGTFKEKDMAELEKIVGHQLRETVGGLD